MVRGVETIEEYIGEKSGEETHDSGKRRKSKT
jgi:hypothetical protein